MKLFLVATAGAVVLLLCVSGHGDAEGTREYGILGGIDIEQKLGAELPLDAAFVDEHGEAVRIGDFFGEKPVIIAPVYYECPMLCSLVLEGFVKALRPLGFHPGQEFEIVVVSFDPGEGPELATKKKEKYLASYGDDSTAGGWHFLTGGEAQIRRVTDALGFRYVYDEKRDEYAHAATIVVATPRGKISKYFYGVEFSTRDLRLGLVEAASGKIGTAIDQFLLYCYHYDPSAGRYSAAVMNIVRVGGIATVSAMLIFFLAMRRRERGAC
jgi:protein SCO1/2